MGASKEFQRNMGDFFAILRGYSFVLKEKLMPPQISYGKRL
jgi:hypothetical protein